MDSILLTALNSVTSKLAKAGGPIAPGVYGVDETFTLRLTGTVEKLSDEMYTPTVDIPLKRVMALLLARMGFQREKAMEMIVDAMTAALNVDMNADPFIDAMLKDVDEAMKHVQSVTAALPPKTRTGKTKVDATMIVVPSTAAVTLP